MNLKKIIQKIIGFDNILMFKAHFSKPNEKQKRFYKQFLTDGDIYFDVGANIGNRIESLIGENIKIIAIEPQKKCVKHLKRKFKNKIMIVNKGVGEKVEVKDFYISNACTLSSFSTEHIEAVKKERFSEFTWNNKNQVQMITMDELINQFGKPKFIKMDIEGYEKEALKGLSVPIDAISFEYTTPEETSSAIECLKRIQTIYEDHVRCNYSVGESFEFELADWISIDEMIGHVNTQNFLSTGFGDIYIRYAE